MLSEPCRLEDSAIGKGNNTTTSTSSTAPNPQAMALYQQILGQAQNVAQTPYQAYTGQLTAPVNAQQTAGINNINANANSAQPYINQAAGLATGAANPLTASQIQNYQNPYTQDVVNATQAQFNDQNAQQQAALKGNQIAQGALGGNRTGIASSNLAGQQQLSQAPTIANLYAQSYNSGLGTAAQQYQQNPLAAAGSLANFGISGQNAALQGAGQQINAGTLQQQTQQAQDTANYGQYAQAQAYPFQVEQWLAGIGTGVAPGLGTTTTGTSTAPAPNQTAQYLGLGLSGAALALSDRDAKRNIHRIGRTNDGQPLFRYQYHGSDQWHIGPIAQEVEKSHPDAVHQGSDGYKYVDLKEATDDSVRRASGGFVQPMAVGGTPWSFADGWVPTVSGLGNAAPHASSAPSAQNPQTPSMDLSKIGNIKLNSNGLLSANTPSYLSSGPVPGDIGPSSVNGMPLIDPGISSANASFSGIYARGGAVHGYADGGMPTMDDRFAPVVDAIQSGDFDPQGGNATDFKGMPGIAAANHGVVPMPVARAATNAVVASDDDDEATPPNATPTAGIGAPATPYARDDAKAGFSRPAPDADSKGFGLGFLSPNAQTGLLTAGLGMLASRSPFLGNAVGEGALQGLNAYGAANSADTKAKQDALKQRMDEQRVQREADALAETIRHNKAQEAKEYQPKLVSQTDPATGETQHMLFDPNTRKLTTLAAPVNNATQGNAGKYVSDAAPVEERRKAPAASPEARDGGYYKWLQDNRPPGYADIVKGVADYEIDPNREASLQKGARDRLYRDVKLYDPTYDQTHFGEKQGVIASFSKGQDRQAVNSLNVSVAHLATLGQLGDELKNGPIPLGNKVANAVSVMTGKPAVTNFDAAKEIVGDEVVKAVVGGVNSQADREAIKHLITSQQTPEQLKGVIRTFTTLLGGQLEGRRQGYQAGTGLNNFDEKYLSPATREALKASGATQVDPAIAKMVYPSGVPTNAGAAPAQTAPAGPVTKVINGVTYVNRNGQWFQQ